MTYYIRCNKILLHGVSSNDNIDNYLNDFLSTTKNTLGLRLQQSLPEEIALHLASCKSSHRNLSIYF